MKSGFFEGGDGPDLYTSVERDVALESFLPDSADLVTLRNSVDAIPLGHSNPNASRNLHCLFQIADTLKSSETAVNTALAVPTHQTNRTLVWHHTYCSHFDCSFRNRHRCLSGAPGREQPCQVPPSATLPGAMMKKQRTAMVTKEILFP